LGKRGAPEKLVVVTTPIKQEAPEKCLAVHAGSLEKKNDNDVFCDACPPPKKKGAAKVNIKPSWHCYTCDFDFCQTCSALKR
jgi:hypothetical protein